jgi:hypothetical protein
MPLYAHMTYVYIVHIASVSDCISMLRLTELHVRIPTWQQSYIFAPCPTPTPAFLLPTWNVLTPVYVSTSDGAFSAGSVEATRYASTSEFAVSTGSVKAAAYASTRANREHELSGSCSDLTLQSASLMVIGVLMFHIGKICQRRHK